MAKALEEPAKVKKETAKEEEKSKEQAFQEEENSKEHEFQQEKIKNYFRKIEMSDQIFIRAINLCMVGIMQSF